MADLNQNHELNSSTSVDETVIVDSPSQIEEQYYEEFSIYMTVIGPSWSGKAQLVERFVDGTFDPSCSHPPRCAPDWKFKLVQCEDESVARATIVLDCVRNVRNEKLFKLYHFHGRYTQGLMIVYNITEMDSIKDVSVCLEFIDKYHPNAAVKVLVGNKIDLEEKREVSYKDGQELAQAHNMLFFETSAKDNINVTEAFMAALTPGIQQAKLLSAFIKSPSSSLFEEAMQSGYVICNLIILLLIGVAGSGKTCFSQLVLDKPPPEVRESTPLAQAAIRAVSTSRAAVSEEGTIWQAVSPSELLSMVAGGIKGESICHFGMQSSLPQSDQNVHKGSTLAKLFRKFNPPKVSDSSVQHENLLVTQSKPSSEKLFESAPVKDLVSHMSKATPATKEVFSENWV